MTVNLDAISWVDVTDNGRTRSANIYGIGVGEEIINLGLSIPGHIRRLLRLTRPPADKAPSSKAFGSGTTLTMYTLPESGPLSPS